MKRRFDLYGDDFDRHDARHVRLRAGISQDEMADRAEVSRRTVVRWETGKAVPSPIVRVRYFEVLLALVDRMPRES